MKEFYELLALETALHEIEQRIDAGAVFYDPYNVNGLLPTLGLSWAKHIAPLLQRQENPGYLPVTNVVQFLAIVKGAEQQLPPEEESGFVSGR